MGDQDCAVLVPDPSVYDPDAHPVRVFDDTQTAEAHGDKQFASKTAFQVIEAVDNRE